MDRVQVRIACVTCNYGWTSDLENQMENVVGWPWYWRRIEPLTEGGVLVLEAWGPQVSSGMERIRRRDPFLWPQRGSRLRLRTRRHRRPAPVQGSVAGGRRTSHVRVGSGVVGNLPFGVSATPRCCPRVLTFLTRGVQGFWHSTSANFRSGLWTRSSVRRACNSLQGWIRLLRVFRSVGFPKPPMNPIWRRSSLTTAEANDHVTSDCSSHPGEAIATPTDYSI